jgi:hypothetical protein
VREKGAKLPSDLDGIKYLELEGRDNIASVESGIREQVERILTG